MPLFLPRPPTRTYSRRSICSSAVSSTPVWAIETSLHSSDSLLTDSYLLCSPHRMHCLLVKVSPPSGHGPWFDCWFPVDHEGSVRIETLRQCESLDFACPLVRESRIGCVEHHQGALTRLLLQMRVPRLPIHRHSTIRQWMLLGQVPLRSQLPIRCLDVASLGDLEDGHAAGEGTALDCLWMSSSKELVSL